MREMIILSHLEEVNPSTKRKWVSRKQGMDELDNLENRSPFSHQAVIRTTAHPSHPDMARSECLHTGLKVAVMSALPS